METNVVLSQNGYDASCCPLCGGHGRSAGLRRDKRGYAVRSRECEACGQKYQTLELYTQWRQSGPRKHADRVVLMEKGAGQRE